MEPCTHPTKVFLYCWQPERWTCRAALVPFDLLAKEQQDLIAEMHAMGPIFRERWNRNSFCPTEDGYQLPDGSVSRCERLARFLSHWQRWADQGETDMLMMLSTHSKRYNRKTGILTEVEREPEQPEAWQRESMFYWLNNNMGHLPQTELYEALCKMTTFEETPIEVVFCIIDTAYAEEQETPRSLRFFFMRAAETSVDAFQADLLEMICTTEEERRRSDVLLSGGSECGFALNLSAAQYERLPRSILEWDGNKVLFD